MGREVKRVDLADPPRMNKPWPGYINPFNKLRKSCDYCQNGYSAAAALYKDQWYGYVEFDPVAYGAKPLSIDDETFKAVIRQKVERSIELAQREGRREYYTAGGTLSLEEALHIEEHRMFEYYSKQWMHHLIQDDVDALVEAGRLYDLTSEWVPGEGWRKRPGVVVTADQVNAWSLRGLSHDSINCWVCVEARCKRNGEETRCLACGGSGEWWPSSELKAQYEAWEPTEPPVGEGYQIWETVSEGSPVSPAFASPEELASWMVQNDTSITKDNTYETWLKFIDAGWAPTSVTGSDGVVKDGVNFVGGSEDVETESR